MYIIRDNYSNNAVWSLKQHVSNYAVHLQVYSLRCEVLFNCEHIGHGAGVPAWCVCLLDFRHNNYPKPKINLEKTKTL